eukprot:8620830-Alexandrium_andersonii.AAC.1
MCIRDRGGACALKSGRAKNEDAWPTTAKAPPGTQTTTRKGIMRTTRSIHGERANSRHYSCHTCMAATRARGAMAMLMTVEGHR